MALDSAERVGRNLGPALVLMATPQEYPQFLPNHQVHPVATIVGLLFHAFLWQPTLLGSRKIASEQCLWSASFTVLLARCPFLVHYYSFHPDCRKDRNFSHCLSRRGSYLQVQPILHYDYSTANFHLSPFRFTSSKTIKPTAI